MKPEVVFKVQKIARNASFCLIMGPFKGGVAVLPDYGPLRLGLGLFLRRGSTVGHPINGCASCYTCSRMVLRRRENAT